MGIVHIDGHPVPQLEGDGNCGECVFNGDALDLGIAPRDRVSVEWSEDTGTSWKKRYTGIAVINGSPQNPSVSGFKLVGLMKKLEEAEARLTLVKGDLGDQAQALVTGTIASGQWGNLFDPTVVRQNVPAVTSYAIIPNYQPVSTVFKEKLCPRLLQSRVAVNENCQVVFGVPSGTLLIDESTAGVSVEWQDVTSEDLLTDVRLQWGAGMNASYYLAQPTDPAGPPPKIDPGSPALFTVLQHTSDFIYTTGNAPPVDNWPYGRSIRSEGIPLSAADFISLPGNTYHFRSVGPSTGATSVSGDPAALSDDSAATSVVVSATADTAAGIKGYIVDFLVTASSLPAGFKIMADQAGLRNVSLYLYQSALPAAGATLICDLIQHHASGMALLPDTVAVAAAGLVFDTIYVSVVFDTSGSLILRSCAPANVLPATLNVARAMDKRPVPSAATVTVPGWVDPQPTVQIQRRGPASEDLGIVTLPGTLFGYEPTGFAQDGSAIGLQTTIQLGQPDTAEVLGDAALIKLRDKQAALKAISVAS